MAKETRPKDYPKLKNYQPTRFMLPTSHYDKKKADRAVTFIENLWGIGFINHLPRPLLIMGLIRMAVLECMWKRRTVPGVLPAMLMTRERLQLNVLLIQLNLIPCMRWSMTD